MSRQAANLILADGYFSTLLRALKRGSDWSASFLFLTVLGPFFALIALFIVLDSPGPVIIVQKRLGCKGELFNCYKFRTMFMEAESILERHLGNNPEAKKQWLRFQKLKSYDPRLTRAGRFLRRLSLDELPQLANVINGEMSLIGPRPYLPGEIEKLGQARTTGVVIQAVRPGLTGLWQVSGRNDIAFADRIALDRYYVENWSPGLDWWIFCKTFGVIISGKGAY